MGIVPVSIFLFVVLRGSLIFNPLVYAFFYEGCFA